MSVADEDVHGLGQTVCELSTEDESISQVPELWGTDEREADMTREEAISWLKEMKDTIELYNDLSKSYTFDKYPQAIDMAISALHFEADCRSCMWREKYEEQTEPSDLAKDCENLAKDCETDLISRADALEQMAQAECGLHYEDCEADNCWCLYIKRILDLPSVSAERVVEKYQTSNGEEYITVSEKEYIPVIRCKDCEYYQVPKQYAYKNSKLCCRSALQKVEENDFCSWAKMKGGAE